MADKRQRGCTLLVWYNLTIVPQRGITGNKILLFIYIPSHTNVNLVYSLHKICTAAHSERLFFLFLTGSLNNPALRLSLYLISTPSPSLTTI